VALEGIDGCGKGVQSERLAEEIGAVRFKFPDYSTPIGTAIEQHLDRKWMAMAQDLQPYVLDKTDALVFQALQAANRLERAQEIANTLADGKSVVADRYTASGFAYGAADGLDLDYLKGMHSFLPQPTHWILIDIDPEISVERRPERRDRYEKNAKLIAKVCLLYRQIWVGNKWPIVDGRGTVEDVADQIRDIISE